MLVYLQFLYVMDNSGWYIALICLSRTIMVGISPCLFCHEQKLIPRFVCRGQYRLVYHPVLSVLDNNGWKINLFCLSWTILICLSIGFVCLDNNSWVISRFCPSLTNMLVYRRVLSVIDNIIWYTSLFCLS